MSRIVVGYNDDGTKRWLDLGHDTPASPLMHIGGTLVRSIATPNSIRRGMLREIRTHGRERNPTEKGSIL